MKLNSLALGLAFFIWLLSAPSIASIAIPTNLTDGEQELVLQILGFGSAFRPVDNPYPLGGYSGVELGLSFENIATEDIGYFGQKSSVTTNFMYPRLTLGKGVYSNIDLFFSFIPYNESTGIGIYSGALRWGFFQATFVPACFSLVISATDTNVDNIFNSQVEGIDLVSGATVDPFSFYVGAGTLYGQGQFSSANTVEGVQTNQVARSFHTMIGVNVSLAQAFAALEVDNYNTTTVSVKLGTRL